MRKECENINTEVRADNLMTWEMFRDTTMLTTKYSCMHMKDALKTD